MDDIWTEAFKPSSSFPRGDAGGGNVGSVAGQRGGVLVETAVSYQMPWCA